MDEAEMHVKEARAMRSTAHALRSICRLVLGVLAAASASAPAFAEGVWIGRDELAALPTEGTAWQALERAASSAVHLPNLSDQNDPTNVRVLAKALVHARTGHERYRKEVLQACMAAIGTEHGGRTLSLGRELLAYVVAADLVGLPEREDAVFRRWLAGVRHQKLGGRTLVSTQEDRPNNWGTHAGATRLAIAVYLDDRADLARAARVFRGYLGDRAAYDGFRYRELSWQLDPRRPVGVNPAGATKNGRSIDGVLPDDQRRAGVFAWPPPRTNYAWEALQGATVAAEILRRVGHDAWEWEDRALLRAVRWLHEQADYPARGDDTWIPHLVNRRYGTSFPAPIPSAPGKNMGFTDWTHAAPASPG